MSRRRRWLVGCVVVALIAAGLWQLNRPNSATAQSRTVEVSTQTIQQTVSGSGTIQPQQRADLSFGVSGRVTKVNVEPGDTVAKGDVLATLDTTSLDAALASAQAQLTAAQTTAANDGSDSSAQQAANTASVASAEADVAEAKDDLAAADLTATFAGTVADVTIEVGDQVGSQGGSSPGAGGASSTSSSSSSTAAVTVISPKKFVVEASVAAADVDQVKKGLQVTVTPSGSSEPVYGIVSEVGRVAETSTSGSATYPVTVKITGEQDGLYAGTNADISIVVKQVDDVLTVPTMALTSEDGVTYVQKIVGSTVKKTKIEIGETYGQSTEVTSGLADGDRVQLTIASVRAPGGDNAGRGQGERGFAGGGGFPGGQLPGGQPPNFSGGGFPGGGR